MNKQKEQIIKNNYLGLVSKKYKLIPNVVRIHNSNALAHELAKTKICYLLQQQGLEYYTETVFVNGKGRADIIVPVKGLVIEVLNSETEKEVLSKQDYYPKEFIISYFTVNEILDDEFIV